VAPKSLEQTWGLASGAQAQQDTVALLMMLHQVARAEGPQALPFFPTPFLCIVKYGTR
jgi:hypothetical protein